MKFSCKHQVCSIRWWIGKHTPRTLQTRGTLTWCHRGPRIFSFLRDGWILCANCVIFVVEGLGHATGERLPRGAENWMLSTSLSMSDCVSDGMSSVRSLRNASCNSKSASRNTLEAWSIFFELNLVEKSLNLLECHADGTKLCRYSMCEKIYIHNIYYIYKYKT